MAGDAFSDYEGPLSGALHLWCFVCAQKSSFAIRVKNKRQIVGVCKTHLSYMDHYRAVGGPEIAAEVRDTNGPLITTIASPKKSLSAAIDEVETYFAKKEGRDPES